MRILSTLLVLLFVLPVLSQKKVIDPGVYNNWKKNEAQLLSANGKYVSYEINPLRGDGYLYLYNVVSEKLDSFPRGKEAVFSSGSNYLAFRIVPGFDTLRNCELNKVDKKKWPKDTLGIYLIDRDSLIRIPMLKSFSVAEESDWMTYVIDENVIRETSQKTKKKKKKDDLTDGPKGPEEDAASKKKKGTNPTDYKSDGKVLTIIDPIGGKSYRYKDVIDHTLSDDGSHIAYVQHQKIKTDTVQLFTLELTTGKATPVSPKYTSVKALCFDPSGKQLAFLSSSDTAKAKSYSLQLLDLTTGKNERIADTTMRAIPDGRSVSENRKPLFTEDGRYLFFGVGPLPEPEKKDTLLESEKVELDIWHYKDKRLQSQQLVELKRDQKKTDLYVYHRNDGHIVQLSNDTLRVQLTEFQKGPYLFASSNEQYVYESQWETAIREDHYRISLVDGTVELIKKAVIFDGQLSPSGTYYSYFDAKRKNYYLLDLNASNSGETCITCSVQKVNWLTDVNGMPMIPDPFGARGYTRGEKDLIIQSEYDLWSYSLSTGKLSCLTMKEGEQNKVRMEIKPWSTDSVYFEFDNLLLSGFDENTKGTHLYQLIDHGDHTDLKEVYYTDHRINYLTRSENKETILFRKMSVKDYPEVRITQNMFHSEKVISSTNPQQAEYNWATVELVKWKAYDGTPLEGLLYKPENFDPKKKYPMIVYYYELSSDELHVHSTPRPTASIIYPTEYASAGYIVFIPDIRYQPGKPAKSAYNCIMSGTDHVLKLVPAIDSTRMGLQGQSWGGYQTAMLITMTNRFKAAMAGAPVGNMFSAYGGIRWGSGMNRQFQYERTQSRIGKTIWEAPELYYENSPLFHLPKVNTPLLIMSNDKDGAVPWYQGIELFTGMKRLGKPCWMFNYNGDDHNLMETANRMDLSIRMRQFFDHYLQGAPAPLWLSEGIPAINKGKITGY